MFGLPADSPLSTVVAELTTTHSRSVGSLVGPEPALLDLLEQVIAAPPGPGSKGLCALHLWHEMAAVVAEYWPYAGQLEHAATPLSARLQEWAGAAGNGTAEPALTALCAGWVERIRGLLGPTAVMPTVGVPCASCTATHWRTGWDGQPVFLPAVVFRMDQAPLQAGCMACGDHWTGDELLQLGRLPLP